MKENLKKIVFIASVALNLVFVGTYIAYQLHPFSGVHGVKAPEEPLFVQLNLSPEQLKNVKVERNRFQNRLQELGQAIKENQFNLVDLLETTPADQQAIKRNQQEIQSVQGQAQIEVIEHFLRVSTLLTSDQRSRFFTLIKSRIQTGLQACPPMMKYSERCLTEKGKKE
jgi:hypothetical protein